jgi:hypothetical protein
VVEILKIGGKFLVFLSALGVLVVLLASCLFRLSKRLERRIGSAAFTLVPFAFMVLLMSIYGTWVFMSIQRPETGHIQSPASIAPGQ